MSRYIAGSLVLVAVVAAYPMRTSGQETGNAVPTATASGRLIRNGSDRDGQRPLALIDQWGAIQSYVRPSEAGALDAYLGKQVTVEGGQRKLTTGRTVLSDARVVGEAARGTGRQAPAKAAAIRSAAYQDELLPGPKAVAAAPAPAAAAPAAAAPAVERSLVRPEAIPAPAPVPGPTAHVPPPPEQIDMQGMPLEGDPGCGPACDGYPCGGCGPCGRMCGPRGGYFVDIDYLLWWTRGMSLPPLVTTGPSVDQPGYIDAPGTQILFGGEQLPSHLRSGMRLKIGTWMDPSQCFGVEFEGLGLEEQTDTYRQWSPGTPLISRPFYDVTRPVEDPQNVQKVAFPEEIAGSVTVDAINRFYSAGVRVRLNKCRDGGCDPCNPFQARRDFIIGYRYLSLSDQLTIREELTSLTPDVPGSFLVQDSFSSSNEFHGVEFGWVFESQRGRWNLEFIPKIALGNTRQQATVWGSTQTTDAAGDQATLAGGLLALSSNIGSYSSNSFSVVPEVDLKLGYALTPWLRFNVGYTFIYWSGVSRAGDQVDFMVNPTLLPNGGPPAGDTTHPKFSFNETGFWAQGVSFGLDYRW